MLGNSPERRRSNRARREPSRFSAEEQKEPSKSKTKKPKRQKEIKPKKKDLDDASWLNRKVDPIRPFSQTPDDKMKKNIKKEKLKKNIKKEELSLDDFFKPPNIKYRPFDYTGKHSAKPIKVFVPKTPNPVSMAFFEPIETNIDGVEGTITHKHSSRTTQSDRTIPMMRARTIRLEHPHRSKASS